MNKGILIFGPTASGKSLLMWKMVRDIKTTDSSVLVYGFDGCLKTSKKINNKHFFDQCDKDTTMVCFDNVHNNIPLDIFYNMIQHGIEVDKKNQKSFTIQPKIVIIFAEMFDLSKVREILERRFEIIETEGVFVHYTKNNIEHHDRV